ncbi:MAG: pilus assembly protein [Thermohalobaculum sp.]|nr:pilus assembly protein [Thermohalobaculum sp.]
MTLSSQFRRCASQFIVEERGTATIELVFWIPFFLLMLFVIIDASTFYWRYTMMWDVTRDLARQVSIGAFGAINSATTTPQLNTAVHGRMGPAFNATLIHDPILDPTTVFDPAVRVSADISALSVFNFFGAFVDGDRQIVTQVRLHLEPF